MTKAHIVAAAGGRRGGRLKDWHPADLGARVLNALVERPGVDRGCDHGLRELMATMIHALRARVAYAEYHDHRSTSLGSFQDAKVFCFFFSKKKVFLS